MLAITRLSVAKPLAVIAIFVAVAVAGLLAYSSLPINLLPSVNIPVVTIVTTYPGAGPLEVEAHVTQVIEDSVASLSNLDVMTSTSSEGASVIALTFTDKANADLIATTVERQVNAVIPSLPVNAQQPTVTKIDLSALPVMQLAVVSDTLPGTDLFTIADQTLTPEFQKVNGVSQVALIGGQKQEIQVQIDPYRLAGYGLSLTQVQTALGTDNLSSPAGTLESGARDYNLRVNSRVTRPEDLALIAVGGTADAPIQLGDVATVLVTGQVPTGVTRVNGHPGVLLRLTQQSGANTTAIADAINQELPDLRAQLPADTQLVVVSDTSTSIRTAIAGVQEELITAVILTAIILLFFLHLFRVSLIVLLSIPTTLLAAFVIMGLLGFSLNELSTLGLVLSIGILVDDSIVILENILRHLAQGEAPPQAAISGRAEIGLAALAITLVDVVIFAPVGLVSGTIGSFFKEFGFTVAATTLMSLVVSFTLTPMLASKFLKESTVSEVGGGPWAAFARWWDHGFDGLEKRYGGLLGWSLGHRLIVLLVALSTLVLGIYLVASGNVGVNFFPETDQGTFTVSTSMSPGTSLAAHDAVMREVEGQLLEIPEIRAGILSASIGGGSGGVFSGGTAGATSGSVSVDVGNKSLRKRGITAIAEEARQRLAMVPGAKIQVNVSGANGGGQPVSILIQGPDNTVLASLSSELEQSFQGIPGLRDVTNSAAAELPELDINVDRTRAAQAGVTPQAVGNAVRLAYSGVVATRYLQPDGQQLDVRVLLPQGVRTEVSNLADLPLQGTNGIVRLSQIADISSVTTASQISRRDRHRQVTVAANLGDGVVQSQVTPAVQQAVKQLLLPVGYTTSQGGTAQQQAQSFGQLGAALGISIMLAYLLMAVLYNSLIHPFVILFGLPLAFGGAVIATFLFHYTLNVFSMIGMILLVGLAIKNGILLVDRTNHNRARGMPMHAALMEAGPTRLRAILMTSLTIAASLTPTAFQLGEGADLRAPLAATVLGGVISSTALTLVVVPVMYTLLDGLHSAIGRRLASLGRLMLRRKSISVLVPNALVVSPASANGHALTNGVGPAQDVVRPTAADRGEEQVPRAAADRHDL
ncbi:MAG TPA: efflux RND transporter permease subunit [Chloroflexota bacterium]|nr:efflux RND transporter permease subunit [Chloroflexota bacterium]